MVTPGGKSGPLVPFTIKNGTEHQLRHGINDYTGWFANDPDMAGEYYGYDGPCPPWNDERVHTYVFTLYALDIPRLPLDGRFTGKEARLAITGPHPRRGPHLRRVFAEPGRVAEPDRPAILTHDSMNQRHQHHPDPPRRNRLERRAPPAGPPRHPAERRGRTPGRAAGRRAGAETPSTWSCPATCSARARPPRPSPTPRGLAAAPGSGAARTLLRRLRRLAVQRDRSALPGRLRRLAGARRRRAAAGRQARRRKLPRVLRTAPPAPSWPGPPPIRARRMALVAHGGVLECAYRLALGLPLETPRDFKVYNASINRFHLRRWQAGAAKLGRGRPPAPGRARRIALKLHADAVGNCKVCRVRNSSLKKCADKLSSASGKIAGSRSLSVIFCRANWSLSSAQ